MIIHLNPNDPISEHSQSPSHVKSSFYIIYLCHLQNYFDADELETNRYMTRMNTIDLQLKHSLHKLSIMSIAEADVIGVQYAGLIMGPLFVKIACLYLSGTWKGFVGHQNDTC